MPQYTTPTCDDWLHTFCSVPGCVAWQGAKVKAQQAQQAKAAVSWQLTMAAKVADLLRCTVDSALDNSPAAMPGEHTHM